MERRFQKRYLRALAVATVSLGGMALLASSASALILTDKSDEQKLRKDIQKQQSKLVDCLVKSALKCEKNGVTISPPECDLSTADDGTPENDDAAFAAGIAKCESKVDYTKKLFGNIDDDYDAIGCPGDSVPGGADDPYSDLVTYQAGASPAAKDQIDTLAAVLAGSSVAACNTEPTPEDQNKCAADIAKRVGGYAKGVFKCSGKCENDYKDKKGNGGPNDAANCALNADGSTPNTAGNANYNACIDKERAKALKKGPLPNIFNLLHSALNDANNDVFNENEVCPVD
jgi:hypothetical protein